MAQTGIHYEKNKWLRRDNSVNIQSRILVLVHCPSSHLSINQVSCQDMAGQATLMKNGRGDNTVNIQGRITVLGFCPAPHCHLSLYQV